MSNLLITWVVFLPANPILRCKSNLISTQKYSFVVLIMENIPRVLVGLAETWTKPNVCVCVCAHTHAGTQVCPTLCDPMDSSPPGFSVHELPFPSSWDLSNLGIEPKSLASPALAEFFATSTTWAVQIYILVINCGVTTSICH